MDASTAELSQSAQQLEIAQQELDKQNAQLNVLGATISSGRNAWFQEQNDLNTQVESQVQEGESFIRLS